MAGVTAIVVVSGDWFGVFFSSFGVFEIYRLGTSMDDLESSDVIVISE